MEIRDYPLSLLDRLSREDIEEYSDYLSYYQKDGKVYTNDERGKKRKLASLRSFYNYYFKEELIEKNPAQLVPLPKLHDKEIVRLDADEVAVLWTRWRTVQDLPKHNSDFIMLPRHVI